MALSEDDIARLAFPAAFERGRKLYRDGCVRSVQIVGDDTIALVRSDGVFRAVLGVGEGEFACTCGFSLGGACEHVVATVLAAANQDAVQMGLALGSPDGTTPSSAFDSDDDLGETVEAVETIAAKPVGRLYLTERGSMLLVEARFAYHGGAVEFLRGDPYRSRLVADGSRGVVRVVRARARETSLLAELAEYDLVAYQSGTFTPAGDAREWVLESLPRLASRGYEIFGHVNLRSHRAREELPEMTVSVSSNDGLFDCDISVSVDGIPAPLAAVVHAVRENSRYVQLSDTSTGVLPEAWLNRFAALFAVLEHDHETDRLRATPAQMAAVEMLCEMAVRADSGEQFRLMKERFRDFDSIGSPGVPKGLRADLRPYQKAGYDWLCFLRDFGFGGCLADDMGLGKTIQALAFLLAEKERDGRSKPSLVVVPTSLIFNWEREAARFAPDLALLVYHGAGRHRYDKVLHMADVVLTTYGSVLRDLEHLKTLAFHCVILDEAQTIKNPASRISRSVRMLNSRHRFTLSGTPVENNLSELWSAFAFLSPGLLGSYSSFSAFYARPIEKDSSDDRVEVLRRLTYPFIMRRTKEQVARDLPPKTETVVYGEMLPRQQVLYEITRDLYQGRIARAMDNDGVEKASMQILEGLLRLRQICCHPRLFDPGFNGDSGKFRLLEESLDDIIAGGHRALVFSQFVSALELIAARLRERDIAYELLTGKTGDRARVVDRFQNDDTIPVFLISLKAGGVGLNLTAADYVIHLDPWWNPAAEKQATDRAYRIGQDKPVFVYKLITAGTVEERVLALQEKKRGLIDSVITSEAGFFKKLSREDVMGLFT